MTDLIKLRNIKKSYGKGDASVTALYPLNLSVGKGEMVAIMGKSGSGKSTLLNIIGGLDMPDEGEYIFDGTPLDTDNQSKMAQFRRKNVGFVVQHFALIGGYTVKRNIELPLRYGGERKLSDKVKTTAGDLGISEKLRKYPSQISGGQAQRAAIARAIVHNPPLLLADEPTGALDEENGRAIMKLFREINTDGTTVIVVTHDPNIAASCDRIIRLHDGRIAVDNA